MNCDPGKRSDKKMNRPYSNWQSLAGWEEKIQERLDQRRMPVASGGWHGFLASVDRRLQGQDGGPLMDGSFGNAGGSSRTALGLHIA